MRIIRALLESAADGRPVSIPAIDIKRRPDLDQEISKKPVMAQPEMVRAAAPGAK